MIMENEIKKPLILEIDEAKNEMVASVNDIIQKHKLMHFLREHHHLY